MLIAFIAIFGNLVAKVHIIIYIANFFANKCALSRKKALEMYKYA